MEKEFLDKLKSRCDSLGIDIDILGDSELLLIYNGTTFNMQYYVWDNKLEIPLSIVSMTIKGKEHGDETYDFVDIDYSDSIDSYDTVDDAVEEVTDIVVNSDDRRKVLKVINSFESFIEDMKQDDLNILLSYVRNKYNLY
jgi:hypothetical protein